MPSLTSILTTLTTLITFASSAPALPILGCILPLKALAQTPPSLPPSGTIPDLPASSLTLAYIALGRGIQNYTCTSPTSTPVAIGAIATLYDATPLAYTSPSTLHTLPPIAVNQPLPPSVLPFATAASLPLLRLGHHYFDKSGTPTFDLDTVGKVLYAAKVMGVKAPGEASKGPAGTGAVDWLKLAAKPAYGSVGLKEVYRVVTAGGQPPACTQVGVVSVEYAAEYWFYG